MSTDTTTNNIKSLLNIKKLENELEGADVYNTLSSKIMN